MASASTKAGRATRPPAAAPDQTATEPSSSAAPVAGRRGQGRRRRPPGAEDAGAWKKDPEGRRRRVLAEATRLFSERGYPSVSTADVAAAAGVAEGSVFHYFGSKPGLLRAVGERYGVEFAAAMFDGADLDVSPASVEALLRRAFTFVGGSYAGFGLFLLSDGAAAAPLARKANREVVTGAIEAALLEWQEKGAMGSIDAPVAAHLLFGLVESALKAAFAPEGGIEPERVIVATVRAMVRILDLER